MKLKSINYFFIVAASVLTMSAPSENAYAFFSAGCHKEYSEMVAAYDNYLTNPNGISSSNYGTASAVYMACLQAMAAQAPKET
ncbi:hypothetical protein [Shewanella fodinae]|uniref:Uncharacterized protein n=1 Tax=Shewanella fodinae TaxID=552357 RepID=A0A4R2FM85_9GAMM|nr:hypothetical protein [Shewanella fodinae]TCN87042.1 hypothetical protein EDC91_10544 [Shewanella fodinae]